MLIFFFSCENLRLFKRNFIIFSSEMVTVPFHLRLEQNRSFRVTLNVKEFKGRFPVGQKVPALRDRRAVFLQFNCFKSFLFLAQSYLKLNDFNGVDVIFSGLGLCL